MTATFWRYVAARLEPRLRHELARRNQEGIKPVASVKEKIAAYKKALTAYNEVETKVNALDLPTYAAAKQQSEQALLTDAKMRADWAYDYDENAELELVKVRRADGNHVLEIIKKGEAPTESAPAEPVKATWSIPAFVKYAVVIAAAYFGGAGGPGYVWGVIKPYIDRTVDPVPTPVVVVEGETAKAGLRYGQHLAGKIGDSLIQAGNEIASLKVAMPDAMKANKERLLTKTFRGNDSFAEELEALLDKVIPEGADAASVTDAQKKAVGQILIDYGTGVKALTGK